MDGLKSENFVKRKLLHPKFLKWFCICFVALCAIAAILGAVHFAVLKSYRNQELHLSESFTVTAHTGGMGTLDNSVESIEKAIAAEADVVEFDVRFRPDGTPVMAHDAVSSDAEGVPIADALQVLAKDGVSIRVNLDIKETENLAALQSIVKQYGLSERVFCTGVTEEFVPAVRSACPEIPYYLNYAPDTARVKDAEYQEELLAVLRETGAIGINCHYKNASPQLADVLHQNGYLLSVWTVDKENQMLRQLVSGADNITSRNPDLLIELIAHWDD